MFDAVVIDPVAQRDENLRRLAAGGVLAGITLWGSEVRLPVQHIGEHRPMFVDPLGDAMQQLAV